MPQSAPKLLPTAALVTLANNLNWVYIILPTLSSIGLDVYDLIRVEQYKTWKNKISILEELNW